MEKVLNRIVRLLETILILIWKTNWLSQEDIMKLIEDTRK